LLPVNLNFIELHEQVLALLIISNLLPIIRKTDFTLDLDRTQFLYALLKNYSIDLASKIIDLIASIKLSKLKKFSLPFGDVISKVFTYISVFPCASNHVALQFGTCEQATIAISESLKRKMSISSINTPSSSTAHSLPYNFLLYREVICENKGNGP
jgi:hypothetical protein